MPWQIRPDRQAGFAAADRHAVRGDPDRGLVAYRGARSGGMSRAARVRTRGVALLLGRCGIAIGPFLSTPLIGQRDHDRSWRIARFTAPPAGHPRISNRHRPRLGERGTVGPSDPQFRTLEVFRTPTAELWHRTCEVGMPGYGPVTRDVLACQPHGDNQLVAEAAIGFIPSVRR
jgi:hypothetical protein